MGNDIVKDLRLLADLPDYERAGDMFEKAADEITRLRAENERLKAENKTLVVENEAIAASARAVTAHNERLHGLNAQYLAALKSIYDEVDLDAMDDNEELQRQLSKIASIARAALANEVCMRGDA